MVLFYSPMPATPLLRPSSVFLAMLSLSIGWGIRGNFGHEAGAMIPGMLCAVVVCLLSGRPDWRERVLYFAFFGSLGWGFGGSMSYMLTLTYTHSGHLPTQIYGFFSVFVIGFLWSALGGAGTAYPAVEQRERLTSFFKPFCFVLALWALEYFALPAFNFRQRNPLYWLDSDWVQISLALVALCLYEFWERRFAKVHLLALYSAAGAGAGLAVHKLLDATGGTPRLLSALVHPQGDPAAFDPAQLVTNWPLLFFDLGGHLGWIFGLIIGAALYFRRHARWDPGASLILHIALGGLLAFLAGPVLLSNLFRDWGGFRLTPPRGDNWAVCVGYLLGVLRYMFRNNLAPVAWASLVAGITGGLGFMLAQFIKILAFVPGSPLLTSDQAVIRTWAHWRRANWHSILAEQGAGLFYGLAIVLGMAMLARRLPTVSNQPRVRRWTEAFSVAFILNVLLYVNLVKNVADWTRERAGGFRSVPLLMKAPLFAALEFSARTWFNIVFLLFTACIVALLVAHFRRPLAIVPTTWTGRGQLFYVVFLWAMVIGNFEKAVVAFHEQRLATEAVIFVNALIATFLLLYLAREADKAPPPAAAAYSVRRAVLAGFAAMIVAAFTFAGITHSIYGNRHDGWGGRAIRFGPDADWRVKPILKDREHR